MAGLETAITMFEDIFFSTAFAGQFWLMQLVILFASILFITRRFSDWGALLLPIMVGWQYAGMRFNYMFWSVATIFFVLNILSIADVSGAIGAVGQTWGTTRKQGGLKQSFKRAKLIDNAQRLNVKEEMQNLRLKGENFYMKNAENELKAREYRNKTARELKAEGINQREADAKLRRRMENEDYTDREISIALRDKRRALERREKLEGVETAKKDRAMERRLRNDDITQWNEMVGESAMRTKYQNEATGRGSHNKYNKIAMIAQSPAGLAEVQKNVMKVVNSPYGRIEPNGKRNFKSKGNQEYIEEKIGSGQPNLKIKFNTSTSKEMLKKRKKKKVKPKYEE